MALKVDYVVRETGTNLLRNITLTLATTVTVAVSLALVGCALLLRQGVENATLQWKGDVELIVYMRPDATPAQIDAVGDDLENSPQVKSFVYLDHPAAYEEFQELFRDDPAFVEAVTPDVLPTNFKVVPVDGTAEVATAIQEAFVQKAGVQEIAAATDTIKTMQRVSGIMSTGILIGAAVLLGAAVVLIVNTIRTAMFARRREIEVMKLVGATNWFIRVPFMMEGLVQSVIGAGFGIAAVFALNNVFESRLANDEGFALLRNFIVDTSDVWGTSMLILVVGCLVGVIGSGVAVTRFLDV